MTRSTLRVPRFQFPKPVGRLDLFVGSIESAVRFLIQLLATSIIWMDFLFPYQTETKIVPESGERVEQITWTRRQFTGHHQYTEACNRYAPNWSVGPDTVLAWTASITFWLLLFPFAHLIFRTFSPGLPRIKKPIVFDAEFDSARRRTEVREQRGPRQANSNKDDVKPARR